MEALGGSLIQGEIERLGVELEDYFGALTEIQMGSAVEVPDKPQALILYETCKGMGLPLWEGGLMDQPNLWVLEYGICDKKSKFFEEQNKASASVKPSPVVGAQLLPE